MPGFKGVPLIPNTSLGRVGGSNQVHVPATTPAPLHMHGGLIEVQELAAGWGQ